MRSNALRIARVGTCAALAAAPQVSTAEEGSEWTISGHLKNTAIASETARGASRTYDLELTRLRIETKGEVFPGAKAEVQYDNELLLGSYLRTPEFRFNSSLPRQTYLGLQGAYAKGSEAIGRHRLRRASVTFSHEAADLRIGRQRIAWGTGRFWSPLDLLNPVSPTALEPGEREGVDAIVLEYKRSAVARTSIVYAPVRGGQDNAFVQWHDNVSGMDYSVTAGRSPDGNLVGVDLAGQLGGAGLRGEWTVTRRAQGGLRQRAMLGLDYAFPNTLTLSAELFFDGSGTGDPARYDYSALFAGRRQSVARRYAGVYARYEFTPLIRGEVWAARNLDDRSWYASPRLTWSARDNVELAAGAQLFGGPPASEFAQRKNLWFASVQYFF